MANLYCMLEELEMWCFIVAFALTNLHFQLNRDPHVSLITGRGKEPPSSASFFDLHVRSITFYLLPLARVGSAFCDAFSFGNSLAYGRNSGAPGRYLRRGSGTRKPCHSHVSGYYCKES